MFKLLRHRMLSLLVMVALTFAMSATAFAHRAPTVDQAALQSFFSAGGTLDDLCSEAAHGGLGGDHCPLCRLDDVAPLTDPVRLQQDAGLRLLRVLRFAIPTASLPPAPGRYGEARAPPFV